MSVRADVAIIGGGIIGMATAYHLSREGVRVAVIDRRYLGAGSTGRCIGGLRHQFSTPSAIRLMKESMALFAGMEEDFGHSVEFHQGGYLLLAHQQELADVFARNVAVQQAEGVDVRIVSPAEIRDIVPHINTDGVICGAYCPQDGQAFPFAVLRGYRKGIAQAGGTFLLHNPVQEIRKGREGVFELELRDGTRVEAPKVLLAAGPWAGELGAKAGLDLPFAPERHEAMITERMPRFFQPMLVDYRKDGCYFHQLVSGQIIGCYSPWPQVPGIREDVSVDFLPQVAWRMSRLMPPLRHASFLRHWSGSYTMTPDGNPILDESPLEGFYVAGGMCGHGFMFGPAMGKRMADFMRTGSFGTDFSEFAYNRDFNAGKESLK